MPNHGIWNVPGLGEGSEFAGNGPFIQGLNAPKNAAGDEVKGPVTCGPMVAEFNGEKVVGRNWPRADNHVSVLKLTYSPSSFPRRPSAGATVVGTGR